MTKIVWHEDQISEVKSGRNLKTRRSGLCYSHVISQMRQKTAVKNKTKQKAIK